MRGRGIVECVGGQGAIEGDFLDRKADELATFDFFPEDAVGEDTDTKA